MKLSKAEILNDRRELGMSAAAPMREEAWTNDAELVRRAAGGDQTAWRRIVEINLLHIHGLAYRMSLSEQQAEDVSQEAFLRLWKIAPRWKPDAKVSTWLYRVARNLMIDVIRKRKTEASEDLGEDIQSDAPTPHEILSAERGRAQIGDAIKRLPERQRTAIMLVHFGECSGAEAAEIMNVSVEAIESLLARGRRGLKKILASEGAV